MNNLIRIVIADDHPALRAGLKAFLTREPDLKVVGEAENGQQARTLCEQLKPEVLVLDLRMAGPPPEATLDRLKTTCPTLKVLIFTAYADRATISRLAARPVAGYVLKEEMTERVVEAIRAVGEGKTWFSQQVVAELLAVQAEKANWLAAVALTPRQGQVLELVVEGRTNDEIAAALKVSKWTVSYHLTRVYASLGVKGRSEAIAWAMRQQPDHR